MPFRSMAASGCADRRLGSPIAPSPILRLSGLNWKVTFVDSSWKRGRLAFRPPRSRENLLSAHRSEEHTSELQSLMRISYAVFCLKKKKTTSYYTINNRHQSKTPTHRTQHNV